MTAGSRGRSESHMFHPTIAWSLSAGTSGRSTSDRSLLTICTGNWCRVKRLIALVLVLAGCSGAGPTPLIVYVTAAPSIAAAATPTPSPSPTPEVTLKPVTIKGTNKGNTKRFELGPGDYMVVVSGKSTSQYGGNVIVYIYNAEGDSQNLANEIVDGAGAYAYTTYEYGYVGGLYYLEVVVPPGTWSVAFTPT